MEYDKNNNAAELGEKRGSFSQHTRGRQLSVDPADRAMVAGDQHELHRRLKGRHMQMIAM